MLQEEKEKKEADEQLVDVFYFLSYFMKISIEGVGSLLITAEEGNREEMIMVFFFLCLWGGWIVYVSLNPKKEKPTSERTLDVPELVDDFYLNLLYWGRSNVLAIALGNTVYLWDASDSYFYIRIGYNR